MTQGASRKILVSLLIGASCALGVLFAEAQTTSCNPSDTACRAKLEAELAQVEKEISIQAALLESKQKEGVSLERDLVILSTQIEKAKLSIKARNLSIAKLTDDIGVKNRTITKYSSKINLERESLAGLMRRTSEFDEQTLIEVMLSDKDISDLFGDLDNFEYVEDAIGKSLEELGSAKKITEEAKAALEEKKNKEVDLRYQKELEQKFLASKEKEKSQVLKVTKGQEAAYQKVLKEKQAKAASIRSALFALRDTGEIPFGTAYDYAKLVSQKTGVRPAFLLAIFMQESGFGKNLGSCLITDLTTGDGKGKNSGKIFEKVMAAPRDTTVFENITQKLGVDWRTTPVSCPIGSATYYSGRGFGGAMGPAQFIPSTWVLFESRIKNALGVGTPDPWRARDAFMAAGFLLKDNGAKSGSYSAERNAACRYFSGSSCSKSSQGATYGNQVMQKAEMIQTTMIDPIEAI